MNINESVYYDTKSYWLYHRCPTCGNTKDGSIIYRTIKQGNSLDCCSVCGPQKISETHDYYTKNFRVLGVIFRQNREIINDNFLCEDLFYLYPIWFIDEVFVKFLKYSDDCDKEIKSYEFMKPTPQNFPSLSFEQFQEQSKKYYDFIRCIKERYINILKDELHILLLNRFKEIPPETLTQREARQILETVHQDYEKKRLAKISISNYRCSVEFTDQTISKILDLSLMPCSYLPYSQWEVDLSTIAEWYLAILAYARQFRTKANQNKLFKFYMNRGKITSIDSLFKAGILNPNDYQIEISSYVSKYNLIESKEAYLLQPYIKNTNSSHSKNNKQYNQSQSNKSGCLFVFLLT